MMSSSDKPPPSKPLSPQEWELLFDEFQQGQTPTWPVSFIIDHALSSLLKRDLPLALKHSLIVFLEEFSMILFSSQPPPPLDRLMDALPAIVQAPIDPAHITYALKEQMMISTTSIFITVVDSFDSEPALRSAVSLVELLLAIINRPNHGVDRHTRGVACECLRELERAYPCLLSEIAGHLWSLCQSERTHASQSYILLFTQVIHGIVVHRVSVSILNTSIPLVPFNVPQWVLGSTKEVSDLNYKEMRRAMAFLLEWPHVFTPCGMVEFMGMMMPLAAALELQPSMLKVQYFGKIYSYEPLLCHVILRMYFHFLDAFDGHEEEISRRLVLISCQAHGNLVFRLIVLHWLLGFFQGLRCGDGKKKFILNLVSRCYPAVFDPLALKALKLDLLALCSVSLENKKVGDVSEETPMSTRVVFEKGLVSVSAFKWMPPWSTETAVALHTFHKFLIGGSSHSDIDSTTTRMPAESQLCHFLQEMLVHMTLESQQLVPVIVAFSNRLLGCQKHRSLGENLLQTLDENLIPKVKIDYKLVTYFPIFDRIAENNAIPPSKLVEILANFMVFIVKNHGVDTGLRSWSQGSKALGICRTLMVHHHSSRLFIGLSRLLAFTCLYFPDLEVRDNARIYLKMLVSLPGKKLTELLSLGEEVLGLAPSAQSGSFFNEQSLGALHDPRKSRSVSAYIHLERAKPPLVKQSWSLSLSNLGLGDSKPVYPVAIKDADPKPVDEALDNSSSAQLDLESVRASRILREPLRVMDARVSELLGTLRQHFSCIPDFRHLPGIKIKIPCFMRFDSETFRRIWGPLAPESGLSPMEEEFPAMYATVLKFSSSAPYGSIPSSRIPFLLGEPLERSNDSSSSAIVPLVNGSNSSYEEDDNGSRAQVTIELEPREPSPGLVDVFLETNTGNGQIIQGQLLNLNVGIEDMFLRAIAPPDVREETVPVYFSDLFMSLWEACADSANFGRETFPLKGGKGVAVIRGTQSVKLLELPAASLIQRTELHLAPFVVSAAGNPLVDLLRDGGIITDVVWKDMESDTSAALAVSSDSYGSGPLRLKYLDDEEDEEEHSVSSFSNQMRRTRNMGSMHVLIFLPPRFHLLLQMEVSDFSTLVRIRTDHWPCLAYIDEYLEALYLT